VAWGKDRKMVQLALSEELKLKIERLADVDRRSLMQECIWLLEQGIRTRATMLGLIDEADGDVGLNRQSSTAAGRDRSRGEATRPGVSSDSSQPTIEFRQATVLAWVVRELYSEGRPVSRFRTVKTIYLIERAQHLGLFERWKKQAAGPYDPKLRYGGPEKIAIVEHQWLTAADVSHFEPGPKIEEGTGYAERWLDVERARKVIGKFLKYTNGALERWTTIDMTAQEIASSGGAVTVETVLAQIDATPEWAPKLKREEFEPAKVDSTLRGLRKEGFLDDKKTGR